jgi:hypothetical protein
MKHFFVLNQKDIVVQCSENNSRGFDKKLRLKVERCLSIDAAILVISAARPLLVMKTVGTAFLP